jgi:two-component system, OmpR family, phosphate regulon sensor histidine kinase PhoR
LRLGAQTVSHQFEQKGESAGIYSATGANLANGDVLICIQDINETAVAIEMRQSFVADLSHELKTPLTAILGILETCDGDPYAMAHFFSIMSGEVDRMKRLVDNLLTLSRVEANERRSPNETIVLQDVVARACAPLEVLAEKMGVRIKKVMPEVPLQFEGDQSEVIRAIMNLVENALLYGKSGGNVQIAGGPNNQTSDTADVTIEVSDEGSGVESHHIPRLTERFYRADAHRSRDTGGSGLGLAIVKHILNHHRGQTKFESQLNQGSKVTLTFPVVQSRS